MSHVSADARLTGMQSRAIQSAFPAYARQSSNPLRKIRSLEETTGRQFENSETMKAGEPGVVAERRVIAVRTRPAPSPEVCRVKVASPSASVVTVAEPGGGLVEE